MKFGVLALQGDFAEHLACLRREGFEAAEVRLPQQLESLAGLIIPGGESTTIGKLATRFGLMEPLRRFGQEHGIWGTCAGAIFLSEHTQEEQPLLELMDISVRRNAFGRQIDSFELELPVASLSEPSRPFPAVFIRAPLIERIGPDVEVLARLPDGDSPHASAIVAARQGRWLATSFHPELTGDRRFHRYFCEQVCA
jgi:5'-phosphate synthase pdxT subunit